MSPNFARPWTADQEASLRCLWRDGVPRGKIAAELDRSLRAISDKVRMLGLPKRMAGCPSGERLDALSAETAPQIAKLRKANIWHLVDLKRAGYSPTMTELQVASDGAILMPSRLSTLSLTGSSAALCVEG